MNKANKMNNCRYCGKKYKISESDAFENDKYCSYKCHNDLLTDFWNQKHKRR